MITNSDLNKNLKDMVGDLGKVKASAQYLLNKLTATSAEELMGPEEGAFTPEDKGAMGGEELSLEPSEGEGLKGGEAKPPKIETPEEAKKTLNEAVTDLKGVIEGIDNISEQGEEMEEKTSSKTFRVSSKFQGEIGVLTQQAIAAIKDSQDAIKHWAFLLAKKNAFVGTPVLQNESLRKTVETVKEAHQAWQTLGGIFGKTATAVPPTGAKFTGDKAINGDVNYSQKKEIKHYQAGNEEFHQDKAKEDKLPNAAAEPRLMDEGNPHELGAYVNAKAVDKNDKFSSALVLRSLNKEGKGKYAVVTWDKLAESVGPKNSTNYGVFLSDAFARNVESHIKRSGIEAVAAYLNAEVDTIGLSKESEKEPKVKDKAKLRAYYADAFGDAEYAKELTSKKNAPAKESANLGAGINEQAANEGTKSGDEMNVNYTPQLDASETEGGLEGGRKDESVGSGKPKTEASLEVRRAKARKAVDFARLAASRGLISFTKKAIMEYAKEVVTYEDAKFAAQKELIERMGEVSDRPLKEARIPENEDVESGIVADAREGVRDPKNTAKETEGLDASVKSDAKIKEAAQKTAEIVPQISSASPNQKESFINKLNTLENRMKAQGLNPEDLTRRVKAHYRPR